MNIAIIFAGGSGVRMGAGMPKQFLEINGRPIIIHTLENFQNCDEIDKIYISCKNDYINQLSCFVKKFNINKVCKIVSGGQTGLESIYNALIAAYEENSDDSIVLIHDGVRPIIADDLIKKNIESVKKHGCGITCTPFFETPVISKDGSKIDSVLLRNEIFTAQAPQSFYLKDILDAHREVRKNNPNYDNIVDSCSLFKSQGHDIYIIQGNRGNIKVTTPEDFYVLRALLQYKENEQILGLK